MRFSYLQSTTLLACFVFTCAASGQQGKRFSFGVKGGIEATSATRFDNNESKRYIIGVTGEINLFRGLAVEADFFYRRYGQSNNFYGTLPSGEQFNQFSQLRHRVFELPVLAKYYFRRDAKWQPFASTGYAFRKIYTESSSEFRVPSQPVSSLRTHRWNDLNVGAVVAGGVRFHAGRVRIAPEFRYTRWGIESIGNISRNQADFLLGITF